MAKNCCVCGKKFGMLESRHILWYGLGEYELCFDCNEEKEKLKLNPEAHEKAVRYFSEYINKPEIDIKVKETLEDIIAIDREKIEEKAKEYELKKNFKYTTGYTFDGFGIIEYMDIISSEVVLGTGIFSEVAAQIDDFLGETSSPLEKKLSEAKRAAKEKLKIKAMDEGANAVIGVDFDIMTIGNNMIVVSASGTAVVIEKLND